MVKNNIIMDIFNILGHPVNKTQKSFSALYRITLESKRDRRGARN